MKVVILITLLFALFESNQATDGKPRAPAFIKTTGACRGGNYVPYKSPKKFYDDTSPEECKLLCCQDSSCTGYTLPSNGEQWCETYESIGSTGNGNSQYDCFWKETCTNELAPDYGNGCSWSCDDWMANEGESSCDLTWSQVTKHCSSSQELIKNYCKAACWNCVEPDPTCGEPCAVCPTCDDEVQNGNEDGVDCGGSCTACPSCSDQIQNQGETNVDCGGPCGACATCNDDVQNQNEDGVDCGGPCPTACPTCSDGVQNQDEVGVDCGGRCTACREIIADGKNCASLTNVACSTCAKYFYGKATLNDVEAKCVWVPEFGGCRTKALAEKKGKDYIEDCAGKDQEDVCLKYNGISDETKTLCCNKNCPKCGGKGCAEFKSKSGEILGRNQCCSQKIKKRGKICGSGGRKAPCKLP